MRAPDPVSVSLSVLGVAYVVGWTRRRTHTGAARRQAGWSTAGFVVLLLALAGPLDAEAGRAVSWHMVQHVLLTAVAAPMLAAGRPIPVLLHALPAPLDRGPRAVWARFVRSTSGRHRLHWLVGATVGFTAVLFAWHVPAWYDAATANDVVHDLEHVTMTVTAVLFWFVVIGRPARAHPAAALAAIFVHVLGSIALGAALVVWSHPLYELGASAGAAAALEDQQIAGVIMWAYGGMISIPVALMVLVRFVGHDDEPTDGWLSAVPDAPLPR